MPPLGKTSGLLGGAAVAAAHPQGIAKGTSTVYYKVKETNRNSQETFPDRRWTLGWRGWKELCW